MGWTVFLEGPVIPRSLKYQIAGDAHAEVLFCTHSQCQWQQVRFMCTLNLLEKGRDYKTNTCFSDFLCASSFQYDVIREKLRIKINRIEIY